MTERNVVFDRLVLYFLGALVGIVSGLTAVAFRALITFLSAVFIIIPNVLGTYGWIITPALGAVIISFMVVTYAPEAKGHGVPEVMASYTFEGGRIRMRVPVIKAISSAFSIGSGGSCGREGPIAQIGAGLGSALAEKLNLGRTETRTLLVCGLSSGIAATFNAPLGGALFGIEIVAGTIIGFALLPVILSSVVATAVATLILGPKPSFISPTFVLGNPIELVFYLVLGVALGIASVVWMRGFYFIEDLFERIRTSKYAIPVIGALLTGVVGVLAIQLESSLGYTGVYEPGEPPFPSIMGSGYSFINASLAGGVALAALASISLLKGFATSFTLGSGGSGGVFAPTLFIGAGLGGAIGSVVVMFVPATVISDPIAFTGAFALVGMAALFAGTARAPITCIVMLMEMTLDYTMILPLMIAVSASYLVSSIIEEQSIYTLKLYRRGVHIRRGLHIGALKTVKVSDIMTMQPTVLRPSMTTDEVFRIIDETHHTKFPVVDDNGNVIGILLAEDLFKKPRGEGIVYRVIDLMNPDFLHLAPSCTMDSALQAMMKRDEGHAVIVDPDTPSRMMGYITKADVLRAYEASIVRLQKAGIDIEDIEPADSVEVEQDE